MELPTLPTGYEPSVSEDYMSALHLAYFHHKLNAWRLELVQQNDSTLKSLAHETISAAESTDRASLESGKAFELRTRDRARKLLKKIDAALQRIETGEYGYCHVTGEEIGLKRLMARPVATMTLEAQESHERTEKMHSKA